MQMLAIDLGKQSFHIYGITGDGEVVSQKVSRAKLTDAVTKLQPQSVAMEACGHVRQDGVISAVAPGHRQAALAVMFSG